VSERVAASAPVAAPEPAPRRRREAVDEARREWRSDADEAAADRVDGADPVHRKVVSARRRLLMMLIALSITAGVLAGTRMAAWWVVVPPSVMLLGYLLLLRSASKADAERREMAWSRMARAAAEAERARVRRPVPAASAAFAVSGTRVAAGARAARGASGASGAKVFSIPATPERAKEQIYDQYADAKLRAVGD
jgi:hypothetical protein